MPDFSQLRDRLRRRLGRGGATPAPQQPTAPATTAEASARDTSARERLAELSEGRRHAEALDLAREEWARIKDDPTPDEQLLRQIQMSASQAGNLTLHLEVLRRRVELAPDKPSLQGYLRSAEGRWRESEPGWLPTIDPAVLADLPSPAERDRSRTRVLHLLKIGMPHRQSGYSMRSMYTISGQAHAGLDPVAVTALDFPRSIGVEDVAAEDVVGGVRYRHLLRDEIPAKEPWDAYLNAYATALAPVVAEEDPDLIHVHSGHRGTEAALVALAVGRALDIPVVYEVRGFFEALWTKDTEWAEQAEVYERRRAAEAHCLREAAAVVTLSESMKDDIVARDVDPDHVHVVPNGVDPEAFVPVARDEALAERLGLTGRFVFGYVSNLDHRREGQELLVDAALELRRRGVDATALIVGDGSRRELLEAHAAERGAGDAVHFTGRIPHDEVSQYYAQLDVFVIPRINERAARLVTPLKPFEAMALGLPLVVSDLPALQEITGNGDRGRTFVTGDASSLADVLEELATSADARQELAAKGRDWVLGHRTWAHNDDRYARIYESVLGPR
ncbi:glycosyltransferase family 4 protein [Janibacter anophelis]|uniref:glycosyltransferase family 4 protein n=1 Tax=Janibacter anophelis TaxID=319054 RepID=UPI003F80C153